MQLPRRGAQIAAISVICYLVSVTQVFCAESKATDCPVLRLKADSPLLMVMFRNCSNRTIQYAEADEGGIADFEVVLCHDGKEVIGDRGMFHANDPPKIRDLKPGEELHMVIELTKWYGSLGPGRYMCFLVASQESHNFEQPPLAFVRKLTIVIEE